MATTPNYEIDYNDERFTKVESDKNQALTEVEQTYGGMINDANKPYDDLANNAQQWRDEQFALQQEQTNFAIEKIEQEKEKANKDYLKEQSGAYVDWQKQSNQYGANAEKMAASGLTNTGFSESSQVSMYNTYQNRVAIARESYQNAVLNYNNAIKDAQLQNSAILAEIAQTALQTQLELALQGSLYKNQLILDMADKKLKVDDMYYNRYQDVLQQINTENQLAEETRRYNETQKWETEQAELNRQHDKTMADIEHKYQLERDRINNEFSAKQAELDRKHDKEMESIKDANERKRAEEQHKRDLEILAQEQKNALAKLDKQLANDKALAAYTNSLSKSSSSGTKITGNSSKSSSSVVSKVSQEVKSTANKVVNAVKNSSGNTPINYQSVLSLGYGPISASKLAQLENEGKITSYVKSGELHFKKTASVPTVSNGKLKF